MPSFLSGQEFKISRFFQGLRSIRGCQKSEEFNFSKLENESVDHKITSFAINQPQISF